MDMTTKGAFDLGQPKLVLTPQRGIEDYSKTAKSQNSPFSSQKQVQKLGSRARAKKNQQTHQSLLSPLAWRFEHDQTLTVNVNPPRHGRKNQISINHLLDFQSYRDLEEYQNNHRRGSYGSHPNQNYAVRKKDRCLKVPLSGMTFINVNYKFVVDNRKQYREQELDPNIPPDTNDIIRIVVPKGNSCPICLTDDPVAPRMISSCGHIICLKCILSLLESEVPTQKKRESNAVVERYRECPLCFSVIRKTEIKPVLINNIDQRFETPKIDDEVVLTLMSRPHNKILPLPKYISEYHDIVDSFPMVQQDQLSPNFHRYLRIFKGDLLYLLQMYETEKTQILKDFEEDKVLYNEPDTYVKMTIDHIDREIATWTEKLNHPVEKTNERKQAKDKSTGSYYYYQTGFDANAVYILSPLDIKVLKTSYNNQYEELPSSLVAKIENIRYEELTPETCLTKYKYLSHLPSGTQLGFMECDWKNNTFLTQEAWGVFKDDLTKRSRNSKKKLNREERDRKRAQEQEELRTRNFFARENGDILDQGDLYERANFGTLSITDHRELPVLANGRRVSNLDTESGSEIDVNEYVSTVWGTKIPKAEYVEEAIEDEDDWDAEEMIRKAKEEMERQELEGKGKGKKKKKKKKLVLLSS